MHEIENAAHVSVGRATGFAGLAIFCLMFGLAFEPALAARTGGICCFFVAGILWGYGYFAKRRPYKRTELWLILPKDKRPPDGIAQKVIGQVLSDTYAWYAKQAALIALVFVAAGLILKVWPVFDSSATAAPKIGHPVYAIEAAEPKSKPRLPFP